MRDRLLALLLMALLMAGALSLRRFAWLGLFGAIMLPLLLATSLLPFASGWIGKWACLLIANSLGTAAALPLYHGWSAALASGRLPDLQFLACAFGISTAILGLPLWHGQVRQRAAQMAALRHAALAAELKALQAQVEPHFLYNTLANARYLARNDPERAAQMLEHLIAYLHSALPDLRAEASTVGRECELAGHYLALMQVRFGERLLYMVDCPPALAAFEQGAIDYVIKPIGMERLARTVARARERLASPPPDLGPLMRRLQGTMAAPSWLQASVGSAIHFIDLADVVYFCADAKYTRVVTDTMEAHIRLSLKELGEALDGAAFWQVHRGYMVAVKRISSAVRGEDGALWVNLRGHAARVPVSQRFQYLFKGM